MLCHPALIWFTYIAPTATAINPTDPTLGAEPRRAAFRRDVSAFRANGL